MWQPDPRAFGGARHPARLQPTSEPGKRPIRQQFGFCLVAKIRNLRARRLLDASLTMYSDFRLRLEVTRAWCGAFDMMSAATRSAFNIKNYGANDAHGFN